MFSAFVPCFLCSRILYAPLQAQMRFVVSYPNHRSICSLSFAFQKSSISKVVRNARCLRSLKLQVQWIPDDEDSPLESPSETLRFARFPSYAYKRSSDFRYLREASSPEDVLSRFPLQQATDMMLRHEWLRVIAIGSVTFVVRV